MIVLEVGINHFGKLSEANSYLNFFLKSNFEYLTFQIQSKEFYKKFDNKINFKLPLKFYSDAIKKVKKKNKKLGLAVCDVSTFKEYEHLNFDFYKLLGVAINDNKLINILSLKKKKVFISLARGSDSNIIDCLNAFKSKDKLNLIYTSMSYKSKDLNLNRINYLKNRFKIPVGYGHHYNNDLPLLLAKYCNPSFIFFYIKKNFLNKKITFPDDQHAFFLEKLDSLNKKLNEVEIFANNNTINTKIKLNDKKIQF